MYQRAKNLNKRLRLFSLIVIRLVAGFRKKPESYIIGRQLIRSATSVGANTAEASAARTSLEFCSILNIALKECQETMYWLQLVEDANLTDVSRVQMAIKELGELGSILGSIIIKVRKKQSK